MWCWLAFTKSSMVRLVFAVDFTLSCNNFKPSASDRQAAPCVPSKVIAWPVRERKVSHVFLCMPWLLMKASTNELGTPGRPKKSSRVSAGAITIKCRCLSLRLSKPAASGRAVSRANNFAMATLSCPSPFIWPTAFITFEVSSGCRPTLTVSIGTFCSTHASSTSFFCSLGMSKTPPITHKADIGPFAFTSSFWLIAMAPCSQKSSTTPFPLTSSGRCFWSGILGLSDAPVTGRPLTTAVSNFLKPASLPSQTSKKDGARVMTETMLPSLKAK
mmetsp:Transcript_11291/g.27118  ORF Transcript_11291/g.27118 Transcript_11291/m.27118 type:complete len:273 (-) Transcript_11291:162-980(-)